MAAIGVRSALYTATEDATTAAIVIDELLENHVSNSGLQLVRRCLPSTIMIYIRVLHASICLIWVHHKHKSKLTEYRVSW